MPRKEAIRSAVRKAVKASIQRRGSRTTGEELQEARRFAKESGATKLMQKMRGKKPSTIKGAIRKK